MKKFLNLFRTKKSSITNYLLKRFYIFSHSHPLPQFTLFPFQAREKKMINKLSAERKYSTKFMTIESKIMQKKSINCLFCNFPEEKNTQNPENEHQFDLNSFTFNWDEKDTDF